MHTCPNCQQRGLSTIGVIFMIHDERISCNKCGTSFTIPKSRKSLVVGIEYVLLLASVALSIKLKSLWPCGVLLLALALARAYVLPKMAVKHTRVLNRLRKYRKTTKPKIDASETDHKP